MAPVVVPRRVFLGGALAAVVTHHRPNHPGKPAPTAPAVSSVPYPDSSLYPAPTLYPSGG